MRKYRANLKANNKKKPLKRLTRKEAKEEEESKAKMRAYWREKKQQSRAIETVEKKEYVNMKRREKYKETMSKKKLSKDKSNKSGDEKGECNGTDDEGAKKLKNDDYKSPATTRKAVARCSEKLPQTPKKWLKVIGGMIKRATPRKRKLMEENDFIVRHETKQQITANRGIADGVRKFFKTYKPTKKNKHLRSKLISSILDSARKTDTQISIRQSLGIQWRNLVHKSFIQEEEDNRKRSDALTEEEIKAVQDYYLNPTVSSEIPTRKSVSKRTLTSKSVMTKSTKAAHDMFSQEHNKRISLDKFRKLRPRNVLTADKTQLRQCLCEYCTNLELKLRLNSLKSLKYSNVYDIVNASLCPKQGEYHNMSCVSRNCKHCGTEKLRKKIRSAIHCDIVTWERWENRKITYGKVER